MTGDSSGLFTRSDSRDEVYEALSPYVAAEIVKEQSEFG